MASIDNTTFVKILNDVLTASRTATRGDLLTPHADDIAKFSFSPAQTMAWALARRLDRLVADAAEDADARNAYLETRAQLVEYRDYLGDDTSPIVSMNH